MKQPDCPYPGLRPFRESEAKFFCGRSQHRIELLTKLEKARFLAVVGASGSGKSSLVMAGLLCDIADGMLMEVPAGNSRVVYFKPGLKPFASLASALGEQIGADAREVDHMLRRSAQGFASVLDFFDPNGTEAYVVVADQFEELFRFARLTKEEIEENEFRKGRRDAPLLDGVHNEAQAFVDLLLAAANHPRRQVFVVLTMRSDLLHRCEAFDRLPGMISTNQYLTPRLQRDQQADAIAVPLKYFDASIKPALVNLILNDLSPEQDQLPILQHALARVWREARERGSRDLTIDDYKAIGGIADALNEHGEIILGKVSSESKGRLGEAEVGRFFTCLAEYDPTGALIRRPMTVAEVAAESGLPADDVRLIADCFRADFVHWLMPMVDEKKPRLDGNEVLDLTHESLLRKWDRLAAAPGRTTLWKSAPARGWMKIERDRRDSLLRLKDQMVQVGWESDGTPLGARALVKLAIWLTPRVPITWFQFRRYGTVIDRPSPPTPEWGRRYGWSTTATRLFLRIILFRMISFWVIGISFVGLVLFLYWRAETAKREAAEQLVRTQLLLAERAMTATEKNSESVVAELNEAKRTIQQVQDRTSSDEATTTPESAQFLSRAVAIQAHEKAVEAVVFLEIEGLPKLASGAQDHTTKLWSLDGTSDRVIASYDATSLTTANGSQLVIASSDQFCRIWSPPDSLAEMKLRDPGADEGVVNGQIIDNGRVLFGTTRGRIGLWKPGEGQSFFSTQGLGVINTLSYYPSQQWVLASSDNGLVQLWSIKAAPAKLILSRKYKSPVQGASFDPTGNWVLIPTATRAVDLVHLGVLSENPVISPEDIYSLQHDNPVVMGCFSPKSDLVATADSRGRIYLWSLQPISAAGDGRVPAPLILSGQSKRVTAMNWDPNGRCLASADENGTVLLWQEPSQRVATGNARLPFVLPGHEAAVKTLAISAKGLFIATGGADKTVRIAPFFPTFAGPYRSPFGGPDDKAMSGGEGLALFDQKDVATRPDLFLSNKELAEKGLTDPEIAKLGLARRLKADQFYVAARWDYSLTSRSFLRASKVKVRNLKTSKEVPAQPVDWGPNASTGGVADLSPGLAKEIGLSPGEAVEIVVDLLTLPEPNAPATAE